MMNVKNIGWIVCVAGLLLAGCWKEERKNPLLNDENIQYIRNSIDVHTAFLDASFEKECKAYLMGLQNLSSHAKARCDNGVEKMFEGFAQNSVGELPTAADKLDPTVWKRVYGISNGSEA